MNRRGFQHIDLDTSPVQDVLNRAVAALDDPTPLMADIAQAMASVTEGYFASESGPGGQPWPRLAESTRRQRAREGTWPGKLLQRSGGMAASVVPSHERTEALLSVNKPYAAIHQFGGRAGRGKATPILARSFMPIARAGGVSQEAEDAILEIAVAWLDQVVSG